jgi:hypothetical protein
VGIAPSVILQTTDEATPDVVDLAYLKRQLVAKWLLVGFIHGVMNTDNMSIAGETIDYGPCAFMDVYHPATVYSSIDTMGRYAYGNQPGIAQWNLARLAETLLPLLAGDKDAAVKEAQDAIGGFATPFETAYAAGLSRKLGLFQPRPDDLSLAQDLLERMARNGADFTLTFRRLCDVASTPNGDALVRSLFTDPTAFDDWAARWRHRLAEEGGEANERRAAMRAANPAFISRNHLVEEAISAAVSNGDFSPFESLLTGGRWVVGFWSRKELSNVLTQPIRILLFAAASFAALRLEQLVVPDPSRFGPRGRLTPRELAVLRLASTGAQSPEVAVRAIFCPERADLARAFRHRLGPTRHSSRRMLAFQALWRDATSQTSQRSCRFRTAGKAFAHSIGFVLFGIAATTRRNRPCRRGRGTRGGIRRARGVPGL